LISGTNGEKGGNGREVREREIRERFVEVVEEI
jgi:hypothetical protein